jgi:hypothetical protein
MPDLFHLVMSVLQEIWFRLTIYCFLMRVIITRDGKNTKPCFLYYFSRWICRFDRILRFYKVLVTSAPFNYVNWTLFTIYLFIFTIYDSRMFLLLVFLNYSLLLDSIPTQGVHPFVVMQMARHVKIHSNISEYIQILLQSVFVLLTRI